MIESLKLTCEAVPVQWEGMLSDGRAVYARARHGRFYVGLADDLETAVIGMTPAYYVQGTLPGEYATSTPELLERLTRLYIEMVNHEEGMKS